MTVEQLFTLSLLMAVVIMFGIYAYDARKKRKKEENNDKKTD